MKKETETAEAAAALRAGEFGKALELLERAPENHETLNDRAVALHQLWRTAEALPLLARALEMKPRYVPALVNRHYMRLAVESALKPPAFKVIQDSGAPATQPPKVSVVIPTYDRPDCLNESVGSVLGQSFKDFEIIVVSDGGSPDAERVCANLTADRIRFVRIEHAGISAALNAGVSRARGEFITYLDDDDIYYPDHLKMLMDVFASRPDVKFAYTQSWRCIQRLKGGRWETQEKVFWDKGPFDAARLRNGNIIQTTGQAAHRREVPERVGGFNENIIGSQDWEWYLRVSEKFDIHFLETPTMEHRVRKGEKAQLSAEPPVMRKSTNMVRYLHRQIRLTSDSPTGRMGYRRMLDKLSGFCARYPEVLDMLDLKELTMRRAYACLYRLGRDWGRMREISKARKAFLAAMSVAPWEVKLIGRALDPSDD